MWILLRYVQKAKHFLNESLCTSLKLLSWRMCISCKGLFPFNKGSKSFLKVIFSTWVLNRTGYYVCIFVDF